MMYDIQPEVSRLTSCSLDLRMKLWTNWVEFNFELMKHCRGASSISSNLDIPISADAFGIGLISLWIMLGETEAVSFDCMAHKLIYLMGSKSIVNLMYPLNRFWLDSTDSLSLRLMFAHILRRMANSSTDDPRHSTSVDAPRSCFYRMVRKFWWKIHQSPAPHWAVVEVCETMHTPSN